MASGPAATLRELPRPVARMVTAANPIAATAIGRRHMLVFPGPGAVLIHDCSMLAWPKDCRQEGVMLTA